MEKLINKLKSLLGKIGLEQDKIDEIVSEVQESEVENDVEQCDGNCDESEQEAEIEIELEAPENDDVETPNIRPDDDNVDETAETDTPVENAEAPVPEVDEVEAEQVVDPNEVNPADIVPETEAPVDAEAPANENPAINELDFQNKIDEQAKTIEGLLTRIDALEDALKKSGVLVDEQAPAGNEVGIDNPRTPANNPSDDPLSDVLNEINGRRF